MNLFYINQYITIVKDKNKYIFADAIGLEQKNTYDFTGAQEEVFLEMINGRGYGRKELSDIFGYNSIADWLKNGYILPRQLDYTGYYSRTRSFYYHSGMLQQANALKDKSVLILGCGGIGTHVSWNLTTLGVGRIDLLDFDVVEEHNLNRQILYDRNDIGLFKVDVLKAKLEAINSEIIINAINLKIENEEQLSDICLKNKYDLIIKSLDSPIYFSLWLDSVCVKNHIKYISSTLTSIGQYIGPTFIPGKSSNACDFNDYSTNSIRISGIAPSVSFVMYQIAASVSEEAFKVLLGLGGLKYIDNIYLENFISNRAFSLRPKKKYLLDGANHYSVLNIHNLIAICILLLGVIFHEAQMTTRILAFVYTVIAPIFITDENDNVYKIGFINLLLYLFAMSVILLRDTAFASIQGLNDVLGSVYAVVLLLSFIFLAAVLFQALLIYLDVKKA
ncbi:MAG: ThiF family adenylyltransferase [Synergistaceae bacterium]|nr:ThiF family adenylyltransferase [Synergistaceae bacterium]